MTRPLRVLFPGALYHVFARGNERRAIFRGEADLARFLELLQLGIERHGWLCHSYCLMPNHYHLLVETPRANLDKGMRHLNGCYAQDFNRRHDRVGHLFQGRYQAVLVEAETQLRVLARYIARNPLAIPGCNRVVDWPWSSYRATIGLEPEPSWLSTSLLLAHFGSNLAVAREELRRYVEGDEVDASPETRGIFLGSDEFVRSQAVKLSKVPEVPRSHWQPIRPPLSALFADSEEPIASAYREWGYTMQEIARHLGCHYSTVSRRLRESEESGALGADG